MTRLAVVVGSTRSGRAAARVGEWVLERGRALVPSSVELDLVDLAEVGLPLLDEPAPAIRGEYVHEHTRRWSAIVAGYDGFVFVVGEHNHGYPASLKNALDHLFAEWNDKAAGFVGYGVHAGGAVAIEQLRVVLGELRVATVRTSVRLAVGVEVPVDGAVVAGERAERSLAMMLGELVSWAEALRGVREGVRS
ncbi:NADPH-dependent FMN reductase [Actinomycetospora sp. TBRC 11914]|uniref:NADPH-dependent FMN reductase n=1 Tax=Actinomycetospora sp. TBRC 11914 TaxID=2729387 RepID=UPI00145E13F5|nr:NAD(P)H-dependent oxidoreductase [Actinomycetospora sp. TBRC 11914]NMO90500.1 NAD(P)H-dependent oxidoreductase [Actinomycetospora sp. TBRC 11914]